MKTTHRCLRSARSKALMLACSAALALSAAGCSGNSDLGLGVQVGFGPPALRGEVYLDSPGPGYVWVPGYWDWSRGEYFWVEGRWALPPHRGSVWDPPRYDRRGHRHYYRPGRWRR